MDPGVQLMDYVIFHLQKGKSVINLLRKADLCIEKQFFVRLDHIRKCFTQKGGIFILEEFNPKTRQIIQRKYKSSMADQICYSVLCVFSYMAAGQEQKKAAQLSPKPQQKIQQKLQTQPQPPQQQKQQHLPSQKTTSPTITKPQQKQPQQQQPSQPKAQQVTIKQTIQPQKPLVTTSAVQPSSQHPPLITSSTSTTQTRPIPSASITTKVSEQIKSKLPQLPPRVQSQSSVTSRGPPPAIPPRSNAPPQPNRSESVQITSKSDEAAGRTLMRQTSVNSIPPQYTPQPPPKFVIPKLGERQNSRSSLGRHNSISGPSAGSPTNSSGSPQMTRRH